MAWGSWISAWHTASDFRSGEILWKASINCDVFWASREKMISKLMLISIWHTSMGHVLYAGHSASIMGCAKVKVAGSWPSQSLWSRGRDVLGNGNSAQGAPVSAWTWGNTEGQRTENFKRKVFRDLRPPWEIELHQRSGVSSLKWRTWREKKHPCLHRLTSAQLFLSGFYRTPGNWWRKLLRQAEYQLEENFQTQSILEGSEFIRNKEQRYCGHCECSGLTSRSWQFSLVK